jgi:hypothetical protein
MNLDRVAGVDDPGEMRVVPGAPPSVVGLTEWRGRVVTVLDLPILVGAGASSALRCVVALRPPLDGTALLVPTPIELRSGEPPETGGEATSPTLLDPTVLVSRTGAEIARLARTRTASGDLPPDGRAPR